MKMPNAQALHALDVRHELEVELTIFEELLC
jgi:hypothetical protein